jgi:hypothetical protein
LDWKDREQVAHYRHFSQITPDKYPSRNGALLLGTIAC